MNGLIETAIAIIVFVTGGGVSILMCFKTEKMVGWLGPLIIGVVIMIPFLYYGNLDINNEQKAKDLKEKMMLDSLSCKGLGSWLINNSSNSTNEEGGYSDKNYPYAQSKYLVCTHGGLSS